jgi:hypothetical protein
MIDDNTHASLLHPTAQIRVYSVHWLGQKSPRRCAGLFTELRQKAASFDHIHHEPR